MVRYPDEAIGEWRRTIRFQRVADRARWPDDGGDRQHNQGDNFQRRKEIAHGVQQFARIEGDQNHQREVNNAVDQQRQRAVAGQRAIPTSKETVAVRGVANSGPTAR